jgi:rare lipoprotein A
MKTNFIPLHIPCSLLVILGLTIIYCKVLANTEGCLIDSGIASWYGANFHGEPTANGETYDMESLTAAHKTLPFNTIVRVVNKDNGRTVTVRINNRGPFVSGRVIDLSRKAAREIDILSAGLAEVDLYLIEEGNTPPKKLQCN